MAIPSSPFLGIFGSHDRGWRAACWQALFAEGIPFFDSTNPGWGDIDEHNGAALQTRIDALVSWQRDALRRATVVLLHLAAEPPEVRALKAGCGLATRFELGLLTGWEKPTFVHLAPGAMGSHYLDAAFRLSPQMRRFATIEEALQAATLAYRDLARAHASSVSCP